MAKPILLITRRLPPEVEGRATTEFDARLTASDTPVLDVLTRENWGLMTSNGHRDSTTDSGWDDAVPYGKAFVQAAPDRMVWATDWPHAGWTKRMMNDAEEVELLYRYVDNDATLLRKILVGNPARLHGFAD